MAVLRIQLLSATKIDGRSPSGVKLFQVESDTKISDNLDDILDATATSNDATLPQYQEFWRSDSTTIQVQTRQVQALDKNNNNSDQGFWYVARINYAQNDSQQDQQALDPADREWDWHVSTDKRDVAIASSLFDTNGFVFPGADASQMVNLGEGDAFVNTAGEPPESGVTRTRSRQIISLTKYVESPSDIGVASYEALDDLVDSLNSNAQVILDRTFVPNDLLMDDIVYGPESENGFTRVKVDFRIIADRSFQHILSFVSAGYNEMTFLGAFPTGLKKITNEGDGQDVVSPRALDVDGKAIPLPAASPFIIENPVHVSGGVNFQKAWGVSFPASVPPLE